jgi:hypothetical protein
MIAKILFVIGFATWLLGNILLYAFHSRRLYQSIWTVFIPFRVHFPFLRFNVVEWLIFGGLLVISLGLMATALSLDHNAPAWIFGHQSLF